LTIENSTNLAEAANWAKYDFAVTKKHDTEPRSAHPFNSQDVYNPAVNFDDFSDDEGLIQEDLVVWVNLGMHHVPHTGDLPNTVFTAAHSAFTIMPANYLENDPSVQTVNMMRVNYTNGVVSEVELFGQAVETCVTDIESNVAYFWNYKGDLSLGSFRVTQTIRTTRQIALFD
jgi:primary-amine oxidase